MVTSERARGAGQRAGRLDALVLETSLTPPAGRSEHIERPRLLDRLQRESSRRLILVAAPPGFGKSTLLAEWARSTVRTVAWLALDDAANDPARFVSGIVAALRSGQPHLGERALSFLRNPAADLPGVVLPALVNDITRSGREVVLVIEDYHLITNPDVHRAMGYLVDRSPAGLQIVLSTRHDPPLPLARLRARGELAELRADELRFSRTETEDFLTRSLGLDLSTEDLDKLHGRTEGWPAALYLAALTLRGQPDPGLAIDQFAGDDRYVVDYLTTEVLARQSPDLRAFLLQISILRRFSGPLCDAVTERDDAAVRLAELERSNLLVVPLDTRREWFRFHHLFGDLLRAELAASNGAALPELHRRASAWYREAGHIVDAADHAIAAGDLRAVAEIVGGSYALFIDQGQIATIMSWLQAIPDAAVGADWLLGFAGAVVYANGGRIDEAERWLALAESAPRTVRGGLDPAALLPALAGTLRLLRGDIAGTVANERQALARASDDAPWTFGPRMVLASGLWFAGAPAEAEAALEAGTRLARRVEVPVNIVYALGVRAAIALDREDEPGARVLVDEATAVLRSANLEHHGWTAMAQIIHGALLGRRSDLSGAAEAIERGIALGERLRAWQVTIVGSLALAEVRQRSGDPTSARRLLARARDILETLPDPGDGFDRLERTEKLLRLRAPRRAASGAAAFWELSPREIEVLRLLPGSLSQREMAAELYVSFNTVRTHTRVIFSKLGVTSRAEAVTRARELGLI